MCSRLVCFLFLYSDESDIDMYDDPEASQKICQLEVFIGIAFLLGSKRFWRFDWRRKIRDKKESEDRGSGVDI